MTEEKTLFDVLHDVWRAKFYMAACAIVTLLIAFVFSNFSNNYYRAEMILAPATPMGQGIQSQNNRIGDAFTRLQAQEVESTAAFLRFEYVYDGVSVASILIHDTDILSAVESDRPFSFSDVEGTWDAPRLSGYLKKRVKLQPVSGTPLRRLVYQHPDKALAMAMIQRVHRVADEMIRMRLLRGANERIKYLNTAMGQTSNPDHRRNLTALLMEQERLKMLVSLDQPFAATIVEPPSVSAKPSWPDPYLVYPAFLLVGLFLGFVISGIRRHGR